MRRGVAILFAIWAAAACAVVEGNATAPTAAPSPTSVAAASPTPTPSPVATRIAWPPMADASQRSEIAVRPNALTRIPMPAVAPAATKGALDGIAAELEVQFTGTHYFFQTLEGLRDLAYHGSEPYMFANTFAPTTFAERVQEMLQIPHPGETRYFIGRSATLDRGWPAATTTGVAVIEATIVFDDEVGTVAAHWSEEHTWVIRAFRQGGMFYILDGAETGRDTLPAMAPFDPAALDSEVAAQVSQHLSQENVSQNGRPMAMYKGTAYWDARKGALDWLAKLAEQGVLTDRHFEGVTAQVVEFAPASFLGDGIVTVRLTGTLVEVMRGVRRTYPVDELVRFQRTAAAHAFWLAVDEQDDNGNWLMHGNYGAGLEPLFHG
jgi:hypothetical protein